MRCTASPTSIAPWTIRTPRSAAFAAPTISAARYLLPIQRSFHLTSIAHIDLQQGRIDQALETYREAIELSRRARHAEGLAQSLRTLGEVLFGLGMHDEALPYLQEAAALFAQLEDPAAEAEMWSRTAAILDGRAAIGRSARRMGPGTERCASNWAT